MVLIDIGFVTGWLAGGLAVGGFEGGATGGREAEGRGVSEVGGEVGMVRGAFEAVLLLLRGEGRVFLGGEVDSSGVAAIGEVCT